ncbi:MAG: ornithine cyclodeaminase family protein [Herbaspirillum sp.]|jgi:ornithine cyclodeaminase/alanine dehydrogenase-like protein (mu-crystallin family)|nr:ornithine cyclodeaminase family protein [Herbaspirillum sp.]
MRLLSEHDVEQLIDTELAIQCAETAFAQQVSGASLVRGRLDMRRASPRAGVLGVAGFGHDDSQLMIKTNCHGWPRTDGPRVTRSLLTLWDMAEVRPISLMSAEGFNDHRTAAGFAAAAKVLAPADASTLAIFGAGKMAMPALLYLLKVRRIRRVLIVGRNAERAEAMAARARQCAQLSGVEVSVMRDAAEAAAQADILVTVTTSDTPVFPGDAVRDGTLVILGGANRPVAREADDALMRRAVIYTDHTEGALEKAGDLIIPLAAGVIDKSAIAGEIGTLIGQSLPAPARGAVHVFKSIGIALQDLVLAHALLSRAEARGLGTPFDAEGASLPKETEPL